MRLFAATIATETNTFSPLPSGINAFMETGFIRPGEYPKDAPLGYDAPLWAARQRAAVEGLTIIEGSCFFAEPAGVTNRRDYEFMRDEILGQLEAALPIDGVLLGLHGAMVAFDYDDVEGDIIERVRALVGPKCVIGVELDPHCHLTVKRVTYADVIVLYKEYPHTDIVECGEHLVDIVLKAIRGQVKPVMSLFDCQQLDWYPTALPPMRDFVDWVKALEREEGVLSISIGHGFPLADVPEMGGRVLVVMDKDKAKGDALATKIGKEFTSMRGKHWKHHISLDDGIASALEFNEGRVVIADPADNAGGGAPSDNTTILRRLMELQVEDAAVGPIWDPIAVRLCFDAGLGAEFPLRFGGKTGPCSGTPIDATATVIGLKRDCLQNFSGTQGPLGDCAAVRAGGVEVVLNTTRTQGLGLEVFRNVGVDPLAKKILVVKSALHFMAEYGPIADKAIFIRSDGLNNRPISEYPYTRVNRPIWPLDTETSPRLLV
ncbi:M81 family metallopeptidase [Allomesorhizobium camelthorni]|uniref:Microcystinase C n=1 Tax=Allomesorhizobium camelthorni TaxID=475069 RepID=A0A6G4WP41_9HYPH|nr:M81 family metallopeptidase [Mesorhizobium camelthorni]NGO56148.1 M81 family metallopeptidase [Mesorhizobium camelthorni]